MVHTNPSLSKKTLYDASNQPSELEEDSGTFESSSLSRRLKSLPNGPVTKKNLLRLYPLNLGHSSRHLFDIVHSSKPLKYLHCYKCKSFTTKIPDNPSPVDCAKFGLQEELFEHIEKNPDCIFEEDQYGNDLLYYASSFGNERIVWLLCELGLTDENRRCLLSAYTIRVKAILKRFNDYSQANMASSKETHQTLNQMLGRVFNLCNPEETNACENQSDLVNLWKPDCSITSRDGTFRVHSWILASRWDYFCEILCAGVEDLIEKEASLDEIVSLINTNKSKIHILLKVENIRFMRALLWYFYTGDSSSIRGSSVKPITLMQTLRFAVDCQRIGLDQLGLFLFHEHARTQNPHHQFYVMRKQLTKAYEKNSHKTEDKSCTGAIQIIRAVEKNTAPTMSPVLNGLVFVLVDEEGAPQWTSNQRMEQFRNLVSWSTSDCFISNENVPSWRAAAHEALLVSRAHFFGPYFSEEWKVDQQDGRTNIVLENISCLNPIMEYLYSDKITNVEVAQAVELIFAASMLSLPSVRIRAEEVVIDNLEDNIIVPLLLMNISSELRSECFQYLVRLVRKNPEENWEKFSEALLDADIPTSFIANLQEKLMESGLILNQVRATKVIEEYHQKHMTKGK